MAARITFSITDTPAEDLPRALRSLASKISIEDITPGADITHGNIRVQVTVPQESDKRRWARENGYEVGGRGRYPAEVEAAYAAHLKAERKRKREERAARKAEREAVSA
jgi:hypothetical protein